jgi:hypothetical protein
MIKDHSLGSGRTLTFTSGKPGFGAVVFAGVIVAMAIAIFATGSLARVAPPENPAGTVVAIMVFACILFVTVTRRWIAEIDLGTRRLKISRRFFGRWTKTIVDCPLDECNVFGTIAYNTDGHISYGVYVQLKHGTRHAIPLKDSTFSEAAKVASQLSSATGIPRLDTKF